MEERSIKRLFSWSILEGVELLIVIIFSGLLGIFFLLDGVNELNSFESGKFFTFVLIFLIINIVFSFIAFLYIRKLKQIGLIFALIPKIILLIFLIFTPLSIIIMFFIGLIAYCKYKIVDNKNRYKNVMIILFTIFILFTVVNLLIKNGYIKNYLDIAMLESKNCENKICPNGFHVEKRCMIGANLEGCCKCVQK